MRNNSQTLEFVLVNIIELSSHKVFLNTIKNLYV